MHVKHHPVYLLTAFLWIPLLYNYKTHDLRLGCFTLQSSMQLVWTYGSPPGEHSALCASGTQMLEHQTPLYQSLPLCFHHLPFAYQNQLLWLPFGLQWQHLPPGQSASILHHSPYPAITPFQVPVSLTPLILGFMQTHLLSAQVEAIWILQICHPHGLALRTLHLLTLCTVATCPHRSTSGVPQHTSHVLPIDLPDVT